LNRQKNCRPFQGNGFSFGVQNAKKNSEKRTLIG
jgi:hypothetical protein